MNGGQTISDADAADVLLVVDCLTTFDETVFCWVILLITVFVLFCDSATWPDVPACCEVPGVNPFLLIHKKRESLDNLAYVQKFHASLKHFPDVLAWCDACDTKETKLESLETTI